MTLAHLAPSFTFTALGLDYPVTFDHVWRGPVIIVTIMVQHYNRAIWTVVYFDERY